MSQTNDEQKKASPKPLEDAIAELGRAAFEQPAICTSWVLVSEWFGGNDEYWIVTLHDDSTPPWRHSGMLDYAVNHVSQEIDEYLGLDDEDDDDEDEDDD
jgi:hypothetical protein